TPIHSLATTHRSPPRLVRHLPDGSLAHAIRIALSPDSVRQNGLVPLIDSITHRLPDQVIADRPDTEPMTFQKLPARADITIILQGAIDLEEIGRASCRERV